MPEIFDASASSKSPSTPLHEEKTESQPDSKETASIFNNLKMPVTKHADLFQSAPSSNPLRAYALRPLRTSFESQLQDEEILLLLRQHPFTQVKWIIAAVILVFLPFFLSAVVPIIGFLPPAYRLVAVVGWYLMTLGFSMEAFLNWFFNVNIVTNKRVIDIDFNSLLYKNFSSTRLDKIEDTTASTAGFFGTVFDYGDVQIQTAAEQEQFEFEKVPHPNEVASFINQLLLK
jgi:uncharacterized membrane protein YdbT with pleckstrin-like domain